MTGPQPPSAERMATVLSAIARQARRTNLVRVAEIRAAFEQAESKGLEHVGWRAVERTAHQLAGSAGTFGFAGVSERARFLERFAAEAVLNPPEPRRLVDARRVLEQASDQLTGDPDPELGRPEQESN